MAENSVPALKRELQYLRKVQPGYVHPYDRWDHRVYPANYPQVQDWVHTDWHLPVQKLMRSDALDIQDTLQSQFKRTSLEEKLAWGAAPYQCDAEFNIAAANGHPNGMVGRNNNFLHQDLNPQYGGGYKQR